MSLVNHKKYWTNKEYKFIRDNASQLTAPQMSEIMGRTIGTIYARACKLGIKFREKP